MDFQDGGCSEEQPSGGSCHRTGHSGVTRWHRLRPEPRGENIKSSSASFMAHVSATFVVSHVQDV